MNSKLAILFSDEFRASVEQNLLHDPLSVALDRRIPNAALVASQVKYLQRAKHKLSTWYSAHCILPGRAFEQSSSEATALRKNYSGRVAIDLTCGLGVDSWALSRGFEQVIALERDDELSAIARENFRRLGTDNILVINELAEDFLNSNFDFSRVDLIYADPDRRSSEGKKLVKLEDCSPNLIELLSKIERVFSVASEATDVFSSNNSTEIPKLVVKLSPLFDVAEITRIFGSGTSVEVISLNDECKEIIAEVPSLRKRQMLKIQENSPKIRAVAIGLGEVEYPFFDHPSHADNPKNNNPFEPDLYKFLIVPDVALQKSRLARRYFSEHGVWIDSDNEYGFAVEKPVGIMGQVIDIQSIEPFNPKELRRRFKVSKIQNIEILKRNFPLSTEELTRALGLSKGKSGSATLRVAFTSVAGGLWQITLC